MKTKNRLIIPTHERPEMLWCCLQERVEIVKKGAKDPSTFPIKWEYKVYPTKPINWSKLVKGGESRLPAKPRYGFSKDSY